MPSPRIPLPNLPLTVTVLSWAFNFVALKSLYAQMTPPAVSLVRFAAMYLVLIAICAARREPLALPKEHRFRILLAGFISMGAYMVLFLEGMSSTSASEGAIVLATAPVFTFVMACAVKQERFSVAALAAAVVAFVGVALVILGGAGAPSSGGSLKGNLIILASAAVWASSVVVMKPVLVDVSPLRMLTLSMPAGLLALIPYGGVAVVQTDYSAIDLRGWLMFGHVAILSGVVAFLCFYEGIRKVGASTATLYQFFVPPTTVFFAWLAFGEKIAPLQAVGLAVIIVGVASSYKARMAAPPSRS
ncbi:MAG TPA: DMT family transporter [Fimbriimonas sp.]